jgi:hypothetical protein
MKPDPANPAEPNRSAGPPNRSAGVPPAVAGASRPRFGEVTIRNRGRLPHWEKESATYFVTFRLADSLPKSVLDRITSERESIIKTANQLHRDLSPDERHKIQRLSTPILEKSLDSGAGACHLQKPAIATEIADTLCHFDDQRYRLFAWRVMPNHAHVVARLLPVKRWRPSCIPGNLSAQNARMRSSTGRHLLAKGVL